jgi:hypothetical protein
MALNTNRINDRPHIISIDHDYRFLLPHVDVTVHCNFHGKPNVPMERLRKFSRQGYRVLFVTQSIKIIDSLYHCRELEYVDFSEYPILLWGRSNDLAINIWSKRNLIDIYTDKDALIDQLYLQSPTFNFL